MFDPKINTFIITVFPVSATPRVFPLSNVTGNFPNFCQQLTSVMHTSLSENSKTQISFNPTENNQSMCYTNVVRFFKN